MSVPIYEIKTEWIHYGIVLQAVQNYYLVEEVEENVWQWGIKYDSGQFEFFTYTSIEKAEKELDNFREALMEYYEE